MDNKAWQLQERRSAPFSFVSGHCSKPVSCSNRNRLTLMHLDADFSGLFLITDQHIQQP